MIPQQHKNKYFHYFGLFILLFFYFQGNSQTTISDSLKTALSKATSDTLKCRILSVLIENEFDDNVWPTYNNEIEKLCNKNLPNLKKGTKLYELYSSHLGSAYINSGYLKKQHGDIPSALELYYKGLKIFEETNSKKLKAETLNNIGFIYKSQNEFDKALECFNQCYKIFEELGDKNFLAVVLNNIGVVYQNMSAVANDKQEKIKLLKKGLSFYERSLKLNEELDNQRRIGQDKFNIGYIYFDLGDTATALENFTASLALREKLDDKKGLSQTLRIIADISLNKGNISDAKKKGELSFKIAKENGFAKEVEYSSKMLSGLYSKIGDWKSAYAMQVLYKQMNDSILNENNKKDLFQKQFQYQYDKKTAADSVKVAAEKEIVAAELRQEKTQKIALYGGLALVILFALFIFNRFKKSQAQSKIIAHQKELVDEKQKEILDSIVYAKRIQSAMLTSETYINKYLTDYFIYYQPKDIVSGDFYWAINSGNKFFMVTADCTGHGVPGAFMSLLNISFLNENISEKNIIEPARILNEQRNSIIKALNTDGNVESKDGMDCILCAFDFENLKLEYAAANNDFYIVREGKLLEFKADKMPVGKSPRENESFTSHTIDLQKGDMIYTLTDGLADQFGGPKGKKFKYKQLEEILISISSLPTTEQNNILRKRFDEWRGKLEQIDDVCIVGVRI